MIFKIVLVVVIIVVALVVWRYTSVGRGARTRDEALLSRLDPVAQRFEEKVAVGADEIGALARSPELRPMLYTMLNHYQRLDLFPEEYLSEQAQAESTLVYWMLHPNELQAAPEAIEPMEKMQREFRGRQGKFYVFRYRMPVGHWSGTAWQLGLAGPLFPDDAPYQGVAGGFSRAGDTVGKVTPSELVDWYVDMLRQKSGA